MRLVLAVLACLALAAPARATTLFDPLTSQTLRGASADGQIHVALKYNAIRNRYRSDDIAAVAVHTPPLLAGDRLDIRLWMQYVNPNFAAKGAWTVSGAQSEHWSLWVAGADGVRINDRLSFDNSDWAVPQQEANFDNYQHYMDVNRALIYTVPRAYPDGAWVFPRSYFIASAGYCCAINPATGLAMNELLLPGDGYQGIQVQIQR